MLKLIILIVAIAAIVIGFCKGFVRQLAGFIGIIFGVIGVHLLSDIVEPMLREHFQSYNDSFMADYIFEIMTAAVIFLGVFLLMQLLTFIIKRLISTLKLGIFDALAGAAFCVFKYMLIISVILNLIVSLDSDSSLSESYKADDGNVVCLVMGLAPAILGTDSPDDMLYRKQKEEAKAISCNKSDVLNVKQYYSKSFIAQYNNA